MSYVRCGHCGGYYDNLDGLTPITATCSGPVDFCYCNHGMEVIGMHVYSNSSDSNIGKAIRFLSKKKNKKLTERDIEKVESILMDVKK